jgi:hypothetical protein
MCAFGLAVSLDAYDLNSHDSGESDASTLFRFSLAGSACFMFLLAQAIRF